VRILSFIISRRVSKMKYNVNLSADNREMNVAVSVKKEEDEPDFFENLGKVFNNVKVVDALPDGATDVVDVD
jgi:hypothetical protein